MSYRKKTKQKFDPQLGYSTKVITDPAQFYETFRNDKGVKLVEAAHPFLKDTMIIDVTLAGRGFVEDSVYEEYPYYRNNIRRGNTLLKIGNQVFWLRKGLKKFFDIGLEYLSGDLKGNHSHYATFREIQNCLNFNDSVDEKDQAICHVWKLVKANGENCQVSYNKEIKMWSISSKNVSIVVKDAKEINNFKDQRFAFATMIARQFLIIVENNKYTPEQLQQFTNYLSEHTLVGEYCGNPQYQHIVKYQEETILFYAIVKNKSEDSCIPPSMAAQFFKKFNLPMTNDLGNCHVGRYTSFRELCEGLTVLFHSVASGKLDQDEEGSVVYLGLEITEEFYKEVAERKMQERISIPQKCQKVNLKVSSLGKLKTLEYRILRKLRQKFRKFTQDNQGHYNTQQKLSKAIKYSYSKFISESKDLMKKCQIQTPFEYYKLIAIYSYKYIYDNFKNPGAFDLLKSAYIDYLSVIMHCIQNNTAPTLEMMTDSELVTALRKKPWTEYNTNVKELFEQQLQKFYPSFKKIMEAKEAEKEGSSSHEDQDDEREKE